MKVVTMKIKDFRCIDDMFIALDPRANVFVGKMGTGKTAILDAIAILLSSDGTRLMKRHDINNDAYWSEIEMLFYNGEETENIVARIDSLDSVDIRYDDMEDESAFEKFVQWLYVIDNSDWGKNSADTVTDVLKRFLPGVSDVFVIDDPYRLCVVKGEDVLDLCQLSDGEVSIISCVGVLTMRVMEKFGYMKNPLDGKGIVLIDELGMHFHPEMQKKVLPTLMDVFPDCQFIVSTNSPHVVNCVEPESVFMLERREDGIVCAHPNESYGKTVDRVLEDIMGMETTRPDDVSRDLHKLFETIEEGDMEDARDRIERLRDDIGADPELVRAGVLVRRMESIGK